MPAMRMKNAIFSAQQLYIMLRLSAIECFPYPSDQLKVAEIITVFMRKQMAVKFSVEDKGSDELIFSGEGYETYKGVKYSPETRSYGSERSPVWYMMKIMAFRRKDIDALNDDLCQMWIWLEDNDYLKNNRPTEKYLREQNLIITKAISAGGSQVAKVVT
jgi:hypothetical protein